MQGEGDSAELRGDPTRAKRGGDAYTDLLLGVYRDVQQQSHRVAEQARELATLKSELGALALAGEQRDLTTREELETSLRLKAREGALALGQARGEDAKLLEELRAATQRDAQRSAKELQTLRARLDQLERRTGELLADLQHERARLSEMRADHEGLQDKLVRSSLQASHAQRRSLRAQLLALLALLAALGAVGWVAWPALTGRG